ncbi:MAG: acyl carrier protein [Pirellulales bacterium]|nr:acyl carrier protein [Pirellulales bacterium]
MVPHQQIRDFLAENFLLSDDGFHLDDNASLLEEGVVDSTGVLELIQFVEETFGLEVADEEIVPDNFDSVNRIASFVGSKTGCPAT